MDLDHFELAHVLKFHTKQRYNEYQAFFSYFQDIFWFN